MIVNSCDMSNLNWSDDEISKFNNAVNDYPCCVLTPPLDFYAIYNLVRSLPENATIIDIGTAWGGTTRFMAEFSPLSKIITCDPYLDKGWTDYWSDRFKQEYSYESTREYLSDLSNVELLHGKSPELFKNWNSEVDMVFEDGSHMYRPLKENLEFWNTFLKPGGVFAGHDYNENFPDVVRAITEFRETNFPNSKLYVVGNVWFFYKLFSITK